MERYNLEYLARLYGPEMDELEARKRAMTLRRTLHSLDKNEANNDKRHRKLPFRILQQGGYLASGVAYGWDRPMATPGVQPDPSDGWCLRLDIARELGKLKPRVRRILELRGEGYSLEETASLVKLSVRRLRELELAAHEVLRAALASEF